MCAFGADPLRVTFSNAALDTDLKVAALSRLALCRLTWVNVGDGKNSARDKDNTNSNDMVSVLFELLHCVSVDIRKGDFDWTLLSRSLFYLVDFEIWWLISSCSP